MQGMQRVQRSVNSRSVAITLACVRYARYATLVRFYVW